MTFSSQAYFATLLSLLHSPSLHPIVTAQRETHTTTWNAELLAGYVTSADTGNEDLVIASRAALTDFCSTPDGLDDVEGPLMRVLRVNKGNDRVVVPTFEILAFLFHVGLIKESDSVHMSLCRYVQRAVYKSGNIRKIEASIRLYGGMASVGDTDRVRELKVRLGPLWVEPSGVTEAKKRLGALLYHPWPKVRVMVVDELWGLFDGQEEMGAKLLGVDWGVAKKAQIQEVVKALGLD